MATAAVGDWIDDFEIIDNSDYEDDHEVAVEDDAHMENAMLKIRDRVVRIGDDGCEHGTVRWMGTFQETGKDLMIGVELDNPKGSNNGSWGNEQLFLTAPDHGLFIPAMGLIKESEFMGENSPKKSANPTNDSLSPAETDVLNDSFYDNISYGLPLDGMEMNANAEFENNEPQKLDSTPSKRKSCQLPALQVASELASGHILYTPLIPQPSIITSDCTVNLEKWYDAIDFSVRHSFKKSASRTSLDSSRSMRRNLDSGETLMRGGIFSFLRWFRFRKSSKKKQEPSMPKIDPEKLRAPSIHSVTSVSSSFHYVPVSFSHLRAKEEENDSKIDIEIEEPEAANSDCNIQQQSPQPIIDGPTLDETLTKHESNASKDSLQKQTGKKKQANLVASKNKTDSAGRTQASRTKRKKRQAPLPPVNRTEIFSTVVPNNADELLTAVANNCNSKDNADLSPVVDGKRNVHVKGKRKAPLPPSIKTPNDITLAVVNRTTPTTSGIVPQISVKETASFKLYPNRFSFQSVAQKFTLDKAITSNSGLVQASASGNGFGEKSTMCSSNNAMEMAVATRTSEKQLCTENVNAVDIPEEICCDNLKPEMSNITVTDEWKNRAKSTQKLIDMFNEMSQLISSAQTEFLLPDIRMNSSDIDCGLLAKSQANEIQNMNSPSQKKLEVKNGPSNLVLYLDSHQVEGLKVETNSTKISDMSKITNGNLLISPSNRTSCETNRAKKINNVTQPTNVANKSDANSVGSDMKISALRGTIDQMYMHLPNEIQVLEIGNVSVVAPGLKCMDANKPNNVDHKLDLQLMNNNIACIGEENENAEENPANKSPDDNCTDVYTSNFDRTVEKSYVKNIMPEVKKRRNVKFNSFVNDDGGRRWSMGIFDDDKVVYNGNKNWSQTALVNVGNEKVINAGGQNTILHDMETKRIYENMFRVVNNDVDSIRCNLQSSAITIPPPLPQKKGKHFLKDKYLKQYQLNGAQKRGDAEYQHHCNGIAERANRSSASLTDSDVGSPASRRKFVSRMREDSSCKIPHSKQCLNTNFSQQNGDRCMRYSDGVTERPSRIRCCSDSDGGSGSPASCEKFIHNMNQDVSCDLQPSTSKQCFHSGFFQNFHENGTNGEWDGGLYPYHNIKPPIYHRAQSHPDQSLSSNSSNEGSLASVNTFILQPRIKRPRARLEPRKRASLEAGKMIADKYGCGNRDSPLSIRKNNSVPARLLDDRLYLNNGKSSFAVCDGCKNNLVEQSYGYGKIHANGHHMLGGAEMMNGHHDLYPQFVEVSRADEAAQPQGLNVPLCATQLPDHSLNLQLKHNGVKADVARTSCFPIVDTNASLPPKCSARTKIKGANKEMLAKEYWPPIYEIVAPELVQLKAKLSGVKVPALRDEPNSIEITKLLRQLELAICQGHCQQASQLAHRLAMFKISCSVIRKRPKLEPATEDEIFLNVFVEDKSTHIGPFQLYVTPLMTVKKLKQTFQMQFDFPSAIQRWILGKQLAADDDATLSSYGIDCNGCPVFLYLMASEYDEVEAYREKLQNYLHALDVLEPQYLEEIDNKIQLAERERRVNDDIIVEDIEHSSPSQVTKVQEVKKPEPEPVGWKCPACTCINFPTRPGCTACATSRPEDYVIPPDYEIPQEEQMRILIENQLEIEMRQEREKQREENYQKILEMELQDVVLNDEVFECFVCFDEVEVGEGIRLRDCLHTFCRRCLAEAVEHNETAEVKCPYIDDNYSCPEKLQDREIRQIVSHEIYERHLQRSIATAENQAENSFHCKNADCRGWCIYEDDINEFLCPVCQHLNCLTCQAIHEQLNCRQYQDRLELEASNNDEAKKTKELLDRMLTRGEAMRCPKCQIILMKKWGCDWLKCSMCQTEICWITRGPRWGPNGTGDTSGGCRCGVNGKKCHPGCNYCH